MVARRSVLSVMLVVLAALLVGAHMGGPAARAAVSAPPGDDTGWRAPLGPPISVLRGFAPPTHRWLAGHRGVDLASGPGAAVAAAGPGVVTYAGTLAGRGVVTISHGTLRTTYEPVQPSIVKGDRVHGGQQIGTVGGIPGHCMPRTCLHWGLLRGDTYLDPLSLLRRGPSRLLPVWSRHGR